MTDKIAPTVGAIVEITGKLTPTLLCTFSLLKLFFEEPELSETVSENLNIVGKSIRTIGIPFFEIATG